MPPTAPLRPDNQGPDHQGPDHQGPDHQRPDNPFSTRYTRPGALPYLRADDASPLSSAELAARAIAHRRSCISGPHGTGKTTILAHLRGHLDYLGGQPSRLVTLRAGGAQARKGAASELWRTLATIPRGGLLIVDGYEQLAWASRWRLLYRAWRKGIRLVVTAHRPPRGFYRLVETGTPQSVARRLALILLDDFPEQRETMLNAPSFDRRWRAAEGNIRQLWATLYEDFEDQLSSSDR